MLIDHGVFVCRQPRRSLWVLSVSLLGFRSLSYERSVFTSRHFATCTDSLHDAIVSRFLRPEGGTIPSKRATLSSPQPLRTRGFEFVESLKRTSWETTTSCFSKTSCLFFCQSLNLLGISRWPISYILVAVIKTHLTFLGCMWSEIHYSFIIFSLDYDPGLIQDLWVFCLKWAWFLGQCRFWWGVGDAVE